jgi:predicted transcriptional regulator
MTAIPQDTLKEAVELVKDGVSIKTAAKYLGISPSSISYLVRSKRYKEIQKKSYLKHREVRLKKMRAYSKKRNRLTNPNNISK